MIEDPRQKPADGTKTQEAGNKPEFAKQPAPPNPAGCKKKEKTAAGEQRRAQQAKAKEDSQTGGPAGEADQSGKPKPCEPYPDLDDLPEPPDPPELPECKRDCKCPKTPTEPTDCFDDLISTQEKDIKEAERATPFRDELKALQDKIKAAKLEYTQTKYAALVDTWKKQDDEIVELLRKLECRLTDDWKCMVQCSVCELIYAIRNNEHLLNGTGQPFAPDGNPKYDTADSLYDLQYWHQRNVDARQAEFDRIKAVLAAWEKPAQTIEKALSDDAQILAAGKSVDDADVPKFLYDVFFLLIPRHLAIAPPAKDVQTKIRSKYADVLCPCDETTDDDHCCGPNTGPLSLRERLVGPLPYLFDPALYSTVICCLVQCRYVPAKDALAAAEGELAAAQERVKTAKAFIEDKRKSLETDAKANLLAYKPVPQTESAGSGSPDTGSTPPPATPAGPTAPPNTGQTSVPPNTGQSPPTSADKPPAPPAAST